MKKIKLIILIAILVLIIITFCFEIISIGEIWKNIHINSLIGTQKIIEYSFVERFIPDFWYKYIIPILNLPFTTLMIVILVLLLLKKY